MIDPDKFIGTEAHNLYNVIEIFEKKIKNLSLINEEVRKKISTNMSMLVYIEMWICTQNWSI